MEINYKKSREYRFIYKDCRTNALLLNCPGMSIY